MTENASIADAAYLYNSHMSVSTSPVGYPLR